MIVVEAYPEEFSKKHNKPNLVKISYNTINAIKCF